MSTQTLNVHDNNKGLFKTYSGVLVDLLNPSMEMINEVDICHSLSQICRFGGHTLDFYSVAEHSLLVAALAPEDLRLEALGHDFTEAYVGDVIKPLKNVLGENYAVLEAKFEAVISKKFGFDKEKLSQVKQYDKQALEFEHSAFKLDNRSSRVAIYGIIESLTGYNIATHSKDVIVKILNNQFRYYYSTHSKNNV